MFQTSKNANRENTSDRNKLQCCYSPFGSGFTEPFLPFEGCSCGSVGKESACNVGALGSIPGLGRSPGEQKGYPLQYSSQENYRVTKSQMWLSLHSSFWFRLFNPMRKPKTLHRFSATAFRISNNVTWKDNGKHHAHFWSVPFPFFQILDPQVLTAVVSSSVL